MKSAVYFVFVYCFIYNVTHIPYNILQKMNLFSNDGVSELHEER